MKGQHRKAALQHRGKAENHQNKLPTLTYTHRETHTHQPANPQHLHQKRKDTVGLWRNRGMGRRSRTRYWEVVNTVRQYLHGSPHTALRHLPPLRPAASPPAFPKPSTLTAGPQIGPSPCLPAWLSSTADVHRGVALDDWIPWALQKAREEERR